MCLCDVFSPLVDRWRRYCRLQCVLPPHLHHCLSSPLPAPLCSALLALFSQSCVRARKDRKRGMKRTQACVRRRCASPCTLMALHTAACVLALIQYEHAVRQGRIKTSALFERGGSVRSSVSKLWEGILSREEPWIFCRPPSVPRYLQRQLFCLPVCERLCLSVFVYLKHVGTNCLRTTNEQLPYHQSRLSRLCELYYNRYLHTLRGLHTCTHVLMHTHIQPHVRQPSLQTATGEEQLHQRQLSLMLLYLIIFSSLSWLCHFTHFFIPFCFSLFSLFVSYPIFFLTFATLCSTYLPGRFSSKEKWCFFFFCFVLYSSPISGELTFFFFFWNAASKDPYHRFFSVHQPAKT